MIDVHSHVVPREISFQVGTDPRWPVVETDGDRGTVMIAGHSFREITSRCWDLEQRLDHMEQHGVATQVLSPMPELFSYWAAASEAEDYCRQMNEWIAGAIRRYPGRFEGFGIVPLQDPDRGADLLTDVRDLGLRGIEVGTNVEGVPLSDSRFSGVLSELERLEIAVFVHAFHPPGFDAFASMTAANAVTFPCEIGYTVGAMIANGVVARFPRLRLCASHGGGALAMILPRLRYMWEHDAAFREQLPASPDVYARRLYYDLLVFDPSSLELLLRLLGPDKIVIGSDFPFMGEDAGAILRRMTGLSIDLRQTIETDNARMLLGLR